MTLRHLRIFTMVYRLGSMSAAAEKLHLSQPAVSTAIREMETYYGVRLFDRLARRLYRTPQGEKMYGYAVHIVSLFDEMEQTMKQPKAQETLRVGASITIGGLFLPDWVAKFREEEPLVQVQVSVRNTGDIEEALLGGELDLAFVEGGVKNSLLCSEPFLEDRLCLLAPKDHPLTQKNNVTLQEVAQYPFVMREEGSASRSVWEEAMRLQGLSPKILWESVSNTAVLQAVIHGVGLGVLPQRLAEKTLKQGRLREVPIRLPALQRQFRLVYHRHKFFTPIMRAFLELAQREAAAEREETLR